VIAAEHMKQRGDWLHSELSENSGTITSIHCTPLRYAKTDPIARKPLQLINTVAKRRFLLKVVRRSRSDVLLNDSPGLGGFWGVEAGAAEGAWTLGKAKRPQPRKIGRSRLFAFEHSQHWTSCWVSYLGRWCIDVDHA
jgi:hypothetical protein